MHKRTLNQTILRSFTESKGRFWSILLLMALGAFGLVGLKVTSPNIDTTTSDYMDRYQAMDLAVLSDYGLDAKDQAELEALAPQAQVEFGYFLDTVIKDQSDAIRVFSQTQSISQFELVEGQFPNQPDQIALASFMRGQYQVGDTIELSEATSNADLPDKPSLDEEATELGDFLKAHRFTITGFVNSPEIISNMELGPAASGSGTLAGYAVVPATCFDMEAYTIARLRYQDLRDLPAFSDDYRDRVQDHQADLDTRLADNGPDRLTTLRQEGKEAIRDGRDEIDQAKEDLAEAKDQLQEGQAEIDTAKQEIADGEKELKEGRQEIADGQKEIDQNRATLESSQKELDAKRPQLQEAADQLAQGEAKLQASKNELDQAKAQIDQADQELAQTKKELDQAYQELIGPLNELNQAKDQLDASKQELDQGWDQWSQGQAQVQALADQLTDQGLDPQSNSDYLTQIATLEAQYQALETAQAEYDQGLAQYQTNKAQFDQAAAPYSQGVYDYNAGYNQLTSQKAAYQQGLKEYQAGKAELASKRQDYQDGLDQVEAGQAEIDQGYQDLQEAQAEVDQGQVELEAAEEELNQHKADLKEAEAELADNQAKYDQEEADALDEIAQAEEDLDQAQSDLDKLNEPAYHTYTRRTIPGGEGYLMVYLSANGISQVGNMFPVVLYLVACLVTVTTMTRFVSEERTNAGILKALGYGDLDVVKKFTRYGFTAGILGTLLGVLAGMYLLPYLLDKTLLSDTILPSMTLDFHWPITVFAIFCAVLVAVLPPLWIAYQELKEVPAQLLLPKPPVKGSSILLERVPMIWRRLSFIQKVTARNLFRYKKRGMMTIIGVAGSVALLFSGLGLQSSLSKMAERQFDDIIGYDALVVEKEDIDATARQELQAKLDQAGIDRYQPVYSKSFTKSIPGVEDEQSIQLLAIEGDTFDPYIQLYDPQKDTEKSLKVQSDGVLINEKLAKILNVEVGDSFTIEDSLRRTYTLKIAGITELYAGHFIYLNGDYYQEVFGHPLQTNSYLLTVKDQTAQNIQAIASDFMSLEAIQAVVQNTSAIHQVNTLVDSLNLVMNVLTIASMLLAVVILYNLTNINVAERIRELSTIKVLGFLNREVTAYIYRETMILSLLGVILGLLSGKLLHRILAETIAPAEMMFSLDVGLRTYAVPVIAIFVILLALGWVVNRRLRHVDMLEALKSNE